MQNITLFFTALLIFQTAFAQKAVQFELIGGIGSMYQFLPSEKTESDIFKALSPINDSLYRSSKTRRVVITEYKHKHLPSAYLSLNLKK